MTRHAAPMVYVLMRKEIGPKNGRWFRLADYADADHLYDEIARWLGDSVNESTVQFAEYRNMPCLGPAPRRIWIADYIAALQAGADPDALMSYVEVGGDAVNFKRCYIGWFESPEEFAADHLRCRVLSAAGLDELRAFVDLDVVAQSLVGSHFEIHGHYFRRPVIERRLGSDSDRSV